MIKCTTRPNMKYLVQLIIWSFLQDITIDIIGHFFNFDIELIYLLLTFFGNTIFGSIIYLYQKKYRRKKRAAKNATFMSIQLITNDNIQRHDRIWKIYLLIIIASFCNFVVNFIFLRNVSRMNFCSSSLDKRIGGILIIFEALFYRYVLKLQIFRHQIFSLLLISICLIITISTEFYFQEFNIFFHHKDFLFLLFLIIIEFFLNSIVDSSEKYLFEYDYINPFRILMIEGISGLLLGIILFICSSSIASFKEYLKNNSKYLIYLILSLFLFMIISVLQEIFRVVTNKIYSPMASSLAEYFSNPIYNILSFIFKIDFQHTKRKKEVYFSINLILTIIISFCGLVYNEFIILLCCGLHHETYKEVSFRAALPKEVLEPNNINDYSEEVTNTTF